MNNESVICNGTLISHKKKDIIVILDNIYGPRGQKHWILVVMGGGEKGWEIDRFHLSLEKINGGGLFSCVRKF